MIVMNFNGSGGATTDLVGYKSYGALHFSKNN